MKTKLYMVDSQKLLEVTAKHGLSNREAALKSQVSPTTMCRLINAADAEPVLSKEETLQKIATSLRVNLLDLV